MIENNGLSDASKVVGTFGVVGLLIGVGQLLASKEVLTKRIVVGRALSSAGLGAASTSILILVPDIPLAAQFGFAALCASLGTSALERLFQRWIDQK